MIVRICGMEQIKELSLVESVCIDHYSADDSVYYSYAARFSSTGFLIWNLHSEIKDEVIYVRLPDGERNIFLRTFTYSSIGEKPTACALFLRFSNLQQMLIQNQVGLQLAVKTVLYRPGADNWSMSNLRGEHVGGSAVRSLCFVSEIHSAETKVVKAANGTFKNGALENVENPCLPISVGAKQKAGLMVAKKQAKDWLAVCFVVVSLPDASLLLRALV
ncbi:hypothetical protein Cgig2_019333 [Carnegiea gigantea]|uniref:Uncharacterized protein n=1 Tax=Carnegiea gigantea TaxID=171969 RepID=A0A9Q1KP01_9CARY|nr:hypothetical protein Cgig2_019333 [Carnegiea gigantea]